jgi:hypothetical protein
LARELIILPRFKRDYRIARKHPEFDEETLEYVFDVMISGGKLPDALREHRLDKRSVTGARPLGSANAAGGPVLSRLRASDITDPKYRREIYDSFRLLERLSLMDQVRDRWLMLKSA